MVYHSNDSEEQAASSGDHDDQDTLDFLSTLESLSLESNDQAGSTELPPDYYYDGPIEGFGSDLGALIDGGTLSLPPFEDSDEEDSRPVDTEEYRRIAIGCATACPPGDTDELYGGHPRVTAGLDDGDAGGSASFWRSEAERYFHEAAKLRSMVLALRSTLEEAEEENEELCCANAMATREVLTLSYQLDLKGLEQGALVANFEAALQELDTEREISLDALKQQAEAHALSHVTPEQRPPPPPPPGDELNDGGGERPRRTDWKARAAARHRQLQGMRRQAKADDPGGSKVRAVTSGALSGLRNAAKDKLSSSSGGGGGGSGGGGSSGSSGRGSSKTDKGGGGRFRRLKGLGGNRESDGNTVITGHDHPQSAGTLLAPAPRVNVG